MKENDELSKGCLLFTGISFLGAMIYMAMGLMFGGHSFARSYLDEDSEGGNIGILKTTFILLIIAIAIWIYRSFSNNKD